MTTRELVRQTLGLTLTLLLLAGCGRAPTAQPAATFAGSMTVSSPGENATAAGGEIEFVTSADGTAIVSLSYVLENDECSYESESVSVTITGGGSTLTPGEPVRIANGKFVFDLLGIQATGQLNSPSEASGTITIKTQQSVDSPSFQQFACDYGTWTWSANAQ